MSIMVKNYKGKVCNMYQDEYKRWLAADLEDADLKPELAKVEGNDDEIKDRFAVALKFGTAGLRGVLGAGTNRIGDPADPDGNRSWIPLRYVYDALKTVSQYQYLLVQDYAEEQNQWMHDGITDAWGGM